MLFCISMWTILYMELYSYSWALFCFRANKLIRSSFINYDFSLTTGSSILYKYIWDSTFLILFIDKLYNTIILPSDDLLDLTS